MPGESRCRRRLIPRSSGCAAAAFILTATHTAPAAAWDARAAEKSTVRVAIIAEKDGKKIFAGHGTGFVIDRGYVATNWHVAVATSLEKAKIPYKLYIISTYVPEFTLAETIWHSEALDLAVLPAQRVAGAVVVEVAAFHLAPAGGVGGKENVCALSQDEVAVVLQEERVRAVTRSE